MTEFLGGRARAMTGDLTAQATDAIVNAANSSLLGGAGVDGAIHRAGGPKILAECRLIRAKEYPDGLPTGKAVITSGGDLAAGFVIHTVGPIYGQQGGNERELLADCYRNSLELARRKNLRSIAFPAISTGVFGYPKQEAAAVASAAIRDFLQNDEFIKETRLVFFSAPDLELFIRHQAF